MSLAIIWSQYTLALLAYTKPEKHPLGKCTDFLRAQMGLPCKHYIHQQCLQVASEPGKKPRIETVKVITVEECSDHWKLRSSRYKNDPIRDIRHPIPIRQTARKPKNKPHQLPADFKPSQSRRARKARARLAVKNTSDTAGDAPPSTAPAALSVPQVELEYAPVPPPSAPPRTFPMSQSARQEAARIPSGFENAQGHGGSGGTAMWQSQRREPPREYGPLPPGWERPHPAPVQVMPPQPISASLQAWQPPPQFHHQETGQPALHHGHFSANQQQREVQRIGRQRAVVYPPGGAPPPPNWQQQGWPFQPPS